MTGDRVCRRRTLFMPVGGEPRPWQPLVDVYRTRDGWLVKADLAGVQAEDLALSVEGTRLTMRGTRHDCTLDGDCRHYRLEISYSRFERTLELPENLERAEIASEFHQGMLLVRIRTGNAGNIRTGKEARDEHG